MGKSIKDCWNEQVKARLEIEEAVRINAQRSERVGYKIGVVGTSIIADSYQRTINKGVTKIVENELPEAEKIGRATATQILNERRKTLAGYLARFCILSLLIGALSWCLSIPLIPSAIITAITALIGAFLTDPRL